MKRFTKDDIETHSEGYGRNSLPAINVKAYDFPSSWKVAEHFKCSEEIAQQALTYAFEHAQEMFWEQASEDIDGYFPGHGGCEVFSEGRSGGWLVVKGLPDISEWDAILVSRWGKFERDMQSAVKDFCSWDNVIEDIEANRWAEEGAERYNFIQRADKSIVCIADANQAAERAREAVLTASPRTLESDIAEDR
jgi:hypothetical protein